MKWPYVLPQSQVISAVSVDHILQVIRRMEKLAVLPLTGSFLDLVIAGHHSIADRKSRYSKNRQAFKKLIRLFMLLVKV